MTIDIVRPMGVPPVREPRADAVQTAPQRPADENSRPVAPDPVRGNAIDMKA
jgi:hypothetical protein